MNIHTPDYVVSKLTAPLEQFQIWKFLCYIHFLGFSFECWTTATSEKQFKHIIVLYTRTQGKTHKIPVLVASTQPGIKKAIMKCDKTFPQRSERSVIRPWKQSPLVVWPREVYSELYPQQFLTLTVTGQYDECHTAQQARQQVNLALASSSAWWLLPQLKAACGEQQWHCRKK